MNRLEFINTGLAVMGLSQHQLEKIMINDPYLLIGKGSPNLVGKNYALIPQADKAFRAMSAAALEQGINIKVVSSYRSFEKQKNIWNSKFLRFKNQGMPDKAAIRKIIEYSTLPGTSRHHWGTDIDLIDAAHPQEGDVLVTEKFHDNGPYNSLREWMEIHSQNYGYIMPYNRDENRSGFKYEPWHYSYAPISVAMLRQFLELDHEELIFTGDLEGEESLDNQFLMSYIKTHVMGIDPVLL